MLEFTFYEHFAEVHHTENENIRFTTKWIFSTRIAVTVHTYCNILQICRMEKQTAKRERDFVQL